MMPLDPTQATNMNPLKRKLWETDPEDNDVGKFRRVCVVPMDNIKVTGASLRLVTSDGQSSRAKQVFANCLCGLNEKNDDDKDCIQCAFCSTHQHLTCHGLQKSPDGQWRCLRCHFIITGQCEWDRKINSGDHCPIQGCSFETRNKKLFFGGYEGQISHFLSHEDVQVVCNFCDTSNTQKRPTFKHARVYRVHLAFVHGANVLNVPLPRAIIPSSLVPVKDVPSTSMPTTSCCLCEQQLASLTEAANHVEFCAARTVIQRARSRDMLHQYRLFIIDHCNWQYDHDISTFDPERAMVKRNGKGPFYEFRPYPLGVCRVNLPPWDCKAGCYGAPKGETMEDNKRRLA